MTLTTIDVGISLAEMTNFNKMTSEAVRDNGPKKVEKKLSRVCNKLKVTEVKADIVNSFSEFLESPIQPELELKLVCDNSLFSLEMIACMKSDHQFYYHKQVRSRVSKPKFITIIHK